MSKVAFELLEDKIWYKDNYKYQLEYTARIRVELILLKPITIRFLKYEKGILHVIPGYAWNGPSGPTMDTDTFIRASLFHDALYQLMEECYLSWDYKELADNILKDICKLDGMSLFRRNYVYQFVDKFGECWVRINPSGVLIAP